MVAVSKAKPKTMQGCFDFFEEPVVPKSTKILKRIKYLSLVRDGIIRNEYIKKSPEELDALIEHLRQELITEAKKEGKLNT
jgi:hypothetical protein